MENFADFMADGDHQISVKTEVKEFGNPVVESILSEKYENYEDKDVLAKHIKCEFKVEILEDHQISVKTEVEKLGDPAAEFILSKKYNDYEDKDVLTKNVESECKVEIFDEFCNAKVRSVYFEEIKCEEIHDASSESEKNPAMQVEGANKMKKLLIKCDKCDYTTKSKYQLQRHQITHTDVKPFKCDKCPYRAKRLDNLKNHQVIHIPFKCSKCSFRTKKPEAFKTHLDDHVKPFKCDKCSYQTKIQDHLKFHQATHDIFKCTKCSYQTDRRKHLKSHQLTHKDEKPFECDKTKKSYYFRNQKKW